LYDAGILIFTIIYSCHSSTKKKDGLKACIFRLNGYVSANFSTADLPDPHANTALIFGLWLNIPIHRYLQRSPAHVYLKPTRHMLKP
jgi:hypothetical protein